MGDPGEPDGQDPVGDLVETTLLDLRMITGLARNALENAAAEAGEDVGKVLKLVQGTGLIVSTLVDTLAVRYADSGGDADPNTLYDRAQQVVEGLGGPPAGIETAGDPVYFARMQTCAANTLAKLWISGYLFGPVPIDAWPNEALARMLLTIEHHADVITLQHEVEHLGDDTD
uniref:hypothetical protein n=1 Tax=Amycolatopsis sp. CA-096443 TaxID=3239919 RepID=UPI003F4927BC